PRLAAVARDLEVPVVRAHPDHVRVLRRLVDGDDRRVVLGAGVGDREAARVELLLPALIVRGEIGRDPLPRVAAVLRTEQILRADVDHAFLRRAGVDRRVPVEAQLRLVRRGERIDLARLAGGAADADDVSAPRLEIDDVGVVRIGNDREAGAAAEVAPVAGADARGGPPQ